MIAIAVASQAFSQILGARTYGAAAINTMPSQVVMAPDNMLAYVKGRVLGKSGEFAYFSFVSNFAGSAPTGGLIPAYSQAHTVPVGDPFEFWVAPGQTLFALGSVSVENDGAGEEVWACGQVAFLDPAWPADVPGSEDAGFTGPKGRFVLR